MNAPRTNPYVGPRTFLKEEGHRFFGRDREARDLLSLVVSHRLVLFYAQSGAGKSSIINTRLIPNLEERKFEVFPVGRVSGDLAPEGVDSNVYTYNLMRKLIQHEADSNILASLSLSQFLASLNSDEKGYFYDSRLSQDKPEDYSQWRHALIIDQFEELFSTHPEAWQKREDFFCQLADAMQDDPYLWVILVMREDYIASLDPYAHLLPDGLKVRYYMQRLGRDAALKAIRNPVAELRPYAPNVAEKLVDDLCSIKVQNPDGSQGTQPGQYVEPVQLQVVCYSLWENLEDGAEITEDDVRKVGDVDKALGTYYAGRVKSVAANEKLNVTENAIRRWFETNLITEGGIRNMVLQEPNKKSGGLLDDDVIQALQSDLVRAEKRSGATWYELTHDRLVEPILADNKAWFEKNSSVLQRQAKLWNDQARNINLLLRDQALLDAMQWAQEHADELREHERDFIKASQAWQDQLEKRQMIERMKLEQAEQQARSANRMRWLTRLAFSLLGLALIAVGFAVSESRQANRTAEQLATKEAEANAAAAQANELANIALARELASQAGDNLDKQLDLAILLGLEAYKKNLEIPALIPQVESTLFDNMQRSLRLRGYLATSQDPALQFVYSPDGRHAAVLKEDGLTLWDLNDQLTPRPVPDTDSVTQYFFSADSSKLIYLDAQGLTFRNVSDLEKFDEVPVNSHEGAVLDIVFSADSSTFATVGENRDITLWELRAGDIPYEIQSFKVDYAEAYAFSPTGRQFAVLDRQGMITIYSMSDGSPLGEPIAREPDTVTAMAFSQDGDMLAIGDKDGNIILWDIAAKKETASKFSDPSELSIQSMLFRFDDAFLISRTSDGITTWNIAEQKQAGETISIPGDLIYSSKGNVFAELYAGGITLHDIPETNGRPVPGTLAVFNADGSVLAVFDESDGSIKLIDVATGKEAGDPFLGQPASVVGMSFSPDGKSLAVVAADGSSRVWDLPSRELKLSTTLPRGDVSALVFSRDGNTLMEGRTDSTFIIWNQTTNRKTDKVPTGYEGRITQAVLSEQGQYIYTVARDGVELIDIEGSRSVRGVFPGDTVVFSPDEELFVTMDEAAETGGCSLYSLPTGGRIRSGLECSPASSSSEKTVQFSVDGNKVALTKFSVEGAGRTTLLNSASGAPIGTFDGYGPAFSPDGKLFYLYDSSTGFPRLFNTDSGELIVIPEGTSSFTFSPVGDVVALTDYSYSFLTLLDYSKGTILAEASTTRLIGFAPDGATAVVQDFTDGSVTFRSVERLEQIGEPITNLLYGGEVTPSPDGKTFAVSDYNGTTLWNISTRKQIGVSQSSVVFSPDGAYAISTDYWSPTRLWNLSTGEMINLGLNRSFVAFTPDNKYIVINDYYYYGYTLWSVSTGRQVGGVMAGNSGILPGGVFDAAGNLPLHIDNNVVDFMNLTVPLVGDPVSSGSGFILSPDEESYAAISGQDGSVSLWSVASPPSIPGEAISDLDVDIEHARLSPDGKTLALSTLDGITLWDPRKGMQLGELEDVHVRPPSYVKVTPDGNFVAVIYTDYNNNTSNLTVWDVRDLTNPQQVGEPIPEGLYDLSPAGDTLITAPYYRMYKLWDVSTGETIGQPLTGDTVFYSRNGEYLMVLDSETIRIHEASTGLQVGELQDSFMGLGPGDHTIVTREEAGIYLRDLSELESYKSYYPADGNSYYVLSPNGKYLAALSGGPGVVWDIETREEVGELEGPTSDYRGFSPDGEIIYFYNYDEETYVLYQTREPNDRITDESLVGDTFAFSPDGAMFATYYSYYYYYSTASSDSDISFYSISSGEKLDNINVQGNLRGFANGGRLLVMIDDGEIELWDAQDPGSRPIPVDYDGILQDLQLSDDGSTLAVYGTSGVMLVELSKPEERAGWIRERTGIVQQMLFSPDGATLATVGTDGLVLWDVASRTPMSETISSEADLIDVRFRPDSKSVIFRDRSGDVFQIDILPNQSVSQKKQLEVPVNSCALGFDLSNNLLTVRENGQGLEIYNVDTEETTDLEFDGDCGNPMAFSADGKSFAYNQGDRTSVFISDPEEGAFGKRRDIVGEPYYYVDLDFVMDDKVLALADSEQHIYFWDIESRALMFRPQQRAQIQTISDGKALILLPAENRLVSLDFAPESLRRSFDAWKEDLCGRVGRNFTDTEWQQYFPGDDFAPTCELKTGGG